MNSARFRRLAVWIGRAVLTLAVTYFLFKSLRVSWSELEQVDAALWQPRLLPLTASVLVVLAAFVYSVALWARLIEVLGGPKLELMPAVGLYFIASLARYIPGKLWQVASLAYLASKRGVTVTVSSSAAILGQIINLGAAAIVATLVLVPGRTQLTNELLFGALVVVALVALVVLIPPILRWALRLAFRVGRGPSEPPHLDAWFGVRWVAAYIPAWIGFGVGFGLLWSSLPALPPVNWPAAVGAFAGAYFVGYAALFAPAGVGVREGAMALLLAPWMGGAHAAVFAVIARIWLTLIELVPLAGVLIDMSRGKKVG